MANNKNINRLNGHLLIEHRMSKCDDDSSWRRKLGKIITL